MASGEAPLGTSPPTRGALQVTDEAATAWLMQKAAFLRDLTNAQAGRHRKWQIPPL